MQKVIIVGPSEVHNFFTEAYAGQWDTQSVTPRVADVFEGLSDGTLSPESSIVLFLDGYFDDPDYAGEYEATVDAIATYAPYALVLVMFYNLNNQPRLEADVRAVQQNKQAIEFPFYSIDVAGDTATEIQSAMDHYLQYVVPVQQEAQAQENGEEYEAPEVQHQPSQPDPASIPAAPSQQAAPGEKKGLILASTSSKGGSGKTSVGLLTASMIYYASKTAADQGLREKPLSVCVVDMDIKDGQIGFIIRKAQPTVLNLIAADKQDDESIKRYTLYDEGMGFHVMLAPKRARTAEYLTPEFYAYLIERLAYMYDVVVLDTSVDYTDVLFSRVVFPMSNAILFVTDLSPGGVYGMKRWVDDVTTPVDRGGPGINLNKIGVIVNKASDDFGISPDLLNVATGGAQIIAKIPMVDKIIKATNENSMSSILKTNPQVSPVYLNIVKTLMPGEVFASPLVVQHMPEETPSNQNQVLPPENAQQPKKRRLGFGW